MRSSCVRAALAAALFASPLAAGDLVVDGKLVSTTTSGPPLAVASTEVVPNLNADMVDGFHASELARSLGNVLTVGLSGGDFTTPAAAMAAITDASGTNPYLVRIGPGVFPQVAVKANVHVVGSGEGATTLRTDNGFISTVTLEHNSSLSDLTVFHGPPQFNNLSWGISVANGFTVRVSRVTVITVGGTGAHESVRVRSGATARLRDVSITASAATNEEGYGLVVDDATVTATGLSVRVIGSGGVLRGVQVTGDSGVEIAGASITVDGAGSGGSLRGIVASGTTTDGTPVVDVLRSAIRVSGAPSKHGIRTSGALVTIADTTLEVLDGGTGLSQSGGADRTTEVTFRGGTLRVTGGTTQIAIQNNIGSGTETVHVFDSQLEAATHIVSTAGAWTTRLVRSHLAGGSMTGGGTIECRYVTDETFAASTTTCP